MYELTISFVKLIKFICGFIMPSWTTASYILERRMRACPVGVSLPLTCWVAETAAGRVAWASLSSTYGTARRTGTY